MARTRDGEDQEWARMAADEVKGWQTRDGRRGQGVADEDKERARTERSIP